MPSIAPWIEVPDGERAVGFYIAAFGAEVRHSDGIEGRVIVARLAVGDAEFWIQEEPSAAGEGPIRMIVSVDDPDAAYARAVAAGATEVAPVYEGHGWRVGRFADPFGHHWEVGRPLS